MPAFLDPRDRRLLIVTGAVMLLLFGLTYLLQPVPPQESIGYPSSYSAQWAGAKGAFLLLQRLGYRAERWEEPPEKLPSNPAGTTLILAEPFNGGTGADRTAIARFVSQGGRLLAIGASGADLAPEATAVETVDWDPDPKTYSARIPSPLTRDAAEITMIAPDTWNSTNRPALALYGEPDKPVVVSYRVGKGQVIWWASPSPLSNGSITQKGNLALFLNSAGAPGSRVLWDEYFHGVRGSLGSYFAKTPLPWAGLQIAIVFLAAIFTFSRRSGPLYVPANESRLSPLEFVETLGDLYHSAHAAPAAVGVAYQRFRLFLLRRLGVPARAKLPEVCHAAAARFGWPETALLDTLARSERAMRNINLDEREALELVRELHDYTHRLGTGREYA
ncbi:MAG: DUF4350 domain-containing protein [Acidobacteriia bacterium]|nr:DUF4350 domain-containing protein [Terriglobia bacterium]